MTEIIDSSERHLQAIAVCHKNAFPQSLSSAMGIPFLTRMLNWYLVNDHAFLFHLEEDGKIVGYCGGIKVDGTQATGSASGMAQHSFKTAVFSFIKKPWLLFHAEVRKKYKLIARNILYKLHIIQPRAKNDIMVNHDQLYVGLVVIGIDPVYQGRGFSKIILNEFERKGKIFGANKLKLTVLPGNNTAIEAYKKSGWQEEVRSGNSVSMFKKINE